MSHLEASEHLASLYRAADPREALPSASAYADALLDLYWRLGETDAFQLAHVVVGVHAQIGLWACHADLPVPAHRYLATACEVAEGTQDRPLLARAFAALSYLYSSAPRGGEGGQPRHALRLLDQAAELSAGADAFTKGWVAGDERTPKCRQPCASGPRLCQGEGAGRRCGFGGVAQIGESGVGERIRDGSAALPWRAGGF